MAHGGKVYEYADTHGIDLASVLDFSANINPLGPPQRVLVAIERALPHVVHYPDARHFAVKEVVARAHGLRASSVLCGNGATEVMELVFRAVRPSRTFVLNPAFSEYADIARRVGSMPTALSLTRADGAWSLPLEALDRQLQPGHLVVINTPHNPTSSVWPWPTLKACVERWCGRGVFVVIDESFIDFLPDGREISAIADAAVAERLFVVRSATKIYSIPGLRFGFGVGHEEFVREIERNRDGWSVNALAQAAACAAYEDAAFLEATHRWLEEEKVYLENTWGADMRLIWHAPGANFFLVDFRSTEVAQKVVQALVEQGIFCRRCDDFQGLGARYVRFAIRSHADNVRLRQAVADAMDGLDRSIP
ncbi:aminotransferase class I/II-fold pyridoxal phosphate-dependent enzyme [Alicyclobacillus fastidiosus]|uniref:Aminotransferase class I/II-fold pyridoxal phosphate-dependent enzyme n=1 Tax=Alicyclobacillus fastidiosus TaxID=392011 RepID=A0ABY6ZLM9_9BACL|nr:aminotransferase class I/II-fold pyridoxal phosphate-dependent enzyme [Alicyclobacillus fastidiosus]WAH43004.1 aminotransferase class I/II-fold pyridoxal phosphate-dependent enzyme [Alicyclobacillus fastidiosus]GMA64974.1 threonine-phosphate decarboxylase [Alicyclobacillus fastidiosus]